MIRTPLGRYYVMSTRFTPDTYRQYKSYISNHIPVGVIYGSSIPISETIPENARLFVIEMLNHSKNSPEYPGKITGIGLIRNRIHFHAHHIYDINRYNRCIYMGTFRVEVQKMTPYEKEMIRRLEFALFHGPYHQKRATGITSLPNDYIRDAIGIKKMLLQLVHREIQDKMD
jgi:hypothetical protein